MEVQATTWLIAAALAGVLLGIAYFGGLWLTIERMGRSNRPAALLFTSFAARLVLVMVGFYLISGGELGRLMACLAGFLVTRWLMIKRIQPGPKSRSNLAGQAD